LFRNNVLVSPKRSNHHPNEQFSRGCISGRGRKTFQMLMLSLSGSQTCSVTKTIVVESYAMVCLSEFVGAFSTLLKKVTHIIIIP